jgi:hypothetical protein
LGKDQQAIAFHVPHQIDKNVDPIRADERRELIVR